MNDQSIDAKQARFIGVDTHASIHVLAVSDGDGGVLEVVEFGTDPEAVMATTDWVTTHSPVRVGVEGSSSYGAALTAALLAAQIPVVEVTRPNRQARRNQGKSDHLDAIQAAHAARTGQHTSPVKSHPLLHELQAHYVFRESALKSRTEVGNQLQALARIRGFNPGKQSRTMITRLTGHPDLALAAQRWLALDDEAKQHHKQMETWLKNHAPELLAQPYIGPVSATQLILASGLNPERVAREAAFARLCGLAPIPASSGKRQRHRLHRGGDRSANEAFWRIAWLRFTRTERSKTYIAKRLEKPTETYAGALRCLKRKLCREITPLIHKIALRHNPQAT